MAEPRKNFNDTTPAAPVGKSNVKWQIDDDGNISAYVDSSSGGPAGGDLTGTYPNPTIADDAVTFAKMQDINASKLLGRGDTSPGGAGDIEEITVGSGLTLSGTTLSASASAGAVVEAKTNGSGAPYSVSATTDLGKTFTNEGASAEVYFALPTAATSVGPYTFICQDSDLLRIVANTGDTIRLYDNVSASAGYIKAVAIGAAVRLVAINATEWLAEAVVGEWDVN